MLTVSANGFGSEKIKMEDETGNVKVNLKLKSGEKSIEAAIDNGHVSNVESFKTMASINHNSEDFSQYANIYEIIQSKYPGVQINNGDLIVRGLNTLQIEPTGNDNSALIVVDGVINDKSILNTIPTSLVESIKVVKDGGSAIYGSRGTNGVIVIRTKK